MPALTFEGALDFAIALLALHVCAGKIALPLASGGAVGALQIRSQRCKRSVLFRLMQLSMDGIVLLNRPRFLERNLRGALGS